ncbi:MAG: 4Fe-4S dicluster domain-containing protein [Bacteriovoracia bacterium]
MKDTLISTLMSYAVQVGAGVRSVLVSAVSGFHYLFNTGELRKEITEQYPDPVSSRTEDDLPPRTRGLLFNDIDRCTGCQECERICPVKCITVETEHGPDPSKKWVSVYDIDFGQCIFCGLCVEACHPGSLVHTKQFEGAVYDVSNLVTTFGRGRISPEQREKWIQARQRENMED